MNKNIDFPQYRKYLNGKGYFKIISDKEWEEIQIIGRKVILNRYTARIFPDKNFLFDLTFDYKNNWVEINENEYNALLEKSLQP
jgi:hypothetical protein